MPSQTAFAVPENWIKEQQKYQKKIPKFWVKSALAIKLKVCQFYNHFMTFTREVKLPTGQAGNVCKCVRV